MAKKTKILILAGAGVLISALSSCTTIRKDRDKTETKTIEITKTKLDTVIYIPSALDSTYAALKDLFKDKGVKVGENTVRYDTVTRYISVRTPRREIPIKAEVTTTKQTDEKKDVLKVERKSYFKLVIPVIILILALIAVIKIKF